MPGQVNEEQGNETPQHVEVVLSEQHSHPDGINDASGGSSGLRDSKGWDGKLRLDRNPLIQNPEALSDPEYSDDENVLPGEEIGADEGI